MDIIGGERDILVTHTSGSTFVAVTVDSGNDNQLKFSPGSGDRGIVDVVWDGNDNDATVLDDDGLNGEDLTDSGTNNGLQILVYETDGSFDLTISVYTGTTVASYTLSLPDERNDGPGKSYFILFDDFGGNQSVFTQLQHIWHK